MAKKNEFRKTMEERLKYLLEDESVSEMSIQGYGTVRESVLDLLDTCEDFGYEEELLNFTEKIQTQRMRNFGSIIARSLLAWKSSLMKSGMVTRTTSSMTKTMTMTTNKAVKRWRRTTITCWPAGCWPICMPA